MVMGALAALGSTPFLNASFPWLQSLVGAVRSVPFFVIGIPLVVAGAIGLGIWSAKLDKFRRFYATIPEVSSLGQRCLLPGPVFGPDRCLLRRINWKCGRPRSGRPPSPLPRLRLRRPPSSCNRCR